MGDVARREERDGRRELVAAEAGRIDAVLAAALPEMSRARLQRLIAEGHVLVNGEPVRKSVRVVSGDHLSVSVPPVENLAAPVDFELPVLFEDEALVAIDKPAGLPVHGAPGEQGPTVAAWFAARHGLDATRFDADYPGVVHRLDKDTTGVLLLAKTPGAQAALSAAFEQRTAKKTYLAVCEGKPARDRAIVDAPISRHPGDRTRMAVTRAGRAARTEYEVLASDRDRSFLLVRPETGRTHQIRVHLAAIGAPVTFDRVYGAPGAGRQMLHAWQLSVPHPAGGQLTVTAPMPGDMLAVVRA
ncbi:MAG: RluA family pseudouridine synthase, partial [Dehalococcoidia bacterium]|nr:RluA family pseudouridine synthase [Dehalococcoidia bacterium]